MQRITLLFASLLLWFATTGCLHAQSITATAVETWTTSEFPSSDYNLNSAYVYLLNGHRLDDVFSGEELTGSERKKLGLKKGDYPQYMYLAIAIKDPLKKDSDITIPLMIHDIRDPKNASRVTEYGGRFLENVPDAVLKDGDILAKVKFESISASGSADFWQKTAKISIDLGKTATSLVAAPLSFLSLTNQVIPQVSTGLNNLEKVSSNGKMTSEFYIKLLDKELSALYQEKVVSATLYKVHWDINKQRAANYFDMTTVEKVDDVRNKIDNNRSVYILVVQTKAEYNTDHSELAYTPQYVERKSKDFRKIRNLKKKEVEKEFLETLKLALGLKHQLELFKKSVNTKYPDWQAYSRMIDIYFDIKKLKTTQLRKVQKYEDPIIKDKYNRLYANVMNDVDLWFNSELLTRAKSIATFLEKKEGYFGYPTLDKSELYSHVELLSFFRDRVQQIEIQGRIPKSIESLQTYNATLKQLNLIEEALFEKAFQIDPNLSINATKEELYTRATNQYPLCLLCAKKVQEQITAIEMATHSENKRRYTRVATEYYNNINCYDNIYQKLDAFIGENKDSLQVSVYILDAMKKDKEELLQLFDTYGKVVSQDYNALKPEELAELLGQYDLNQKKLNLVLQRLEGIIFDRSETPCLYAQP